MQEENNPYATPEAPITLEKSQSVIDGPQGIGGWLILPILGLFVSLFLWAGQVYEVVQVINSETWPALTELNSDSYHYMWQPILLFELVGQILFIPFGLFLCTQVFQKKSRTPKLFILLYIVLCVFVAIDTGMMAILARDIVELEDPSLFSDLIRSIVTLIVWGNYFHQSKRVKNTFVN
ncbi:DUF2569 domain-containing protein [Neisseria sp. Ec49-e6-T10]|uniref:DUF2569 domain-containing protein n=1 Tax=Neisseria sp. Ec49-e6-T10 TaxID=3140744 RepID=UPI003EB70D58